MLRFPAGRPVTVTVRIIEADPNHPFAPDELRSWIGNHGPQLTAAGITTCTVIDAEVTPDGLYARITNQTDDDPSHSQPAGTVTPPEYS